MSFRATASFRSLKLDSGEPEPPATWSFALRGGTAVDVINVERTLWLAFTYHTLHSDPNEPEHLSFRGFQNFCKECKLFNPGTALAAELQLIFTSHTSKRGLRNLDFSSFLEALMAVAQRIEGPGPFERFIRERVILLVSKREERSLTTSAEAHVEALLREFAPGIQDIFTFYASASARKQRLGQSERSARGTPSPLKLRNHMTDAMSYSNFRDFALDFGLAALDLTAVDLADVFLLELANTPEFDPAHVPGKLDFTCFSQSLIRCAQLAFARFPVDDSRRLKSLFAHCWRAMEEGVPRAIAERRITQGYAGGLLHGSARFSGKFAHMWKVDGYPDYLIPVAPSGATALDLVRSM